MDDNISIIVFKCELVIISQIERITPTVIGDPDVRLIEPFKLEYLANKLLTEDNSRTQSYKLTPWMIEFTDDNDFFVHSDEVLVSMNPTTLLKKLYNDHLKKSILSNN